MLDIPDKSPSRSSRKHILAVVLAILFTSIGLLLFINQSEIKKYYYWVQISEKMRPENTNLATNILRIDPHNEPLPFDLPEFKHPNDVLGWSRIGDRILIEVIMPEFNQARYYIYLDGTVQLIAAKYLG